MKYTSIADIERDAERAAREWMERRLCMDVPWTLERIQPDKFRLIDETGGVLYLNYDLRVGLIIVQDEAGRVYF